MEKARSTRRSKSVRAAGSGRGRALVAGGAGFIGSHLCDCLIAEGFDVVCLDNLQTGSVENIAPLRNHPAFRFVEGDVRRLPDLMGPFSFVFNLACPASPPHYQNDPVGTLQTCVNGACNLLELARRHKARLLQASTSEVYGDPEIHPQPETYRGHVNPIGPRACYDEGKRAAETLCFDYRRVHGVDVKVARIFNTYGPRMHVDDGRVVSNFVVQALRNQPLTIYGDGSQTRSLCYVDDLIDGLRRLVDSPPEVSGPCNLGNPRELSIEEIARMVIAGTGSRSGVTRRPLPVDDPRRRRPVVAFADEILGWKPVTPFERGLEKTIDYFSLKLRSRQGALTSLAPRQGVKPRPRRHDPGSRVASEAR